MAPPRALPALFYWAVALQLLKVVRCSCKQAPPLAVAAFLRFQRVRRMTHLAPSRCRRAPQATVHLVVSQFKLAAPLPPPALFYWAAVPAPQAPLAPCSWRLGMPQAAHPGIFPCLRVARAVVVAVQCSFQRAQAPQAQAAMCACLRVRVRMAHRDASSSTQLMLLAKGQAAMQS